MSRLTELYKQQSIKVGAETDAKKRAAQEKERHREVEFNTKYLRLLSNADTGDDYYQDTLPVELNPQKQALFCEATKLVHEDKWNSFVDGTDRKPLDLYSIDKKCVLDADGCSIYNIKECDYGSGVHCTVINHIRHHLGKFYWADGSVHCTYYNVEIKTKYLRKKGLIGTILTNKRREKAVKACRDKMREAMDIIKGALHGEQKFVYLLFDTSNSLGYNCQVSFALFQDGMLFPLLLHSDSRSDSNLYDRYDQPKVGLKKFMELTVAETEAFIAKSIAGINGGNSFHSRINTLANNRKDRYAK